MVCGAGAYGVLGRERGSSDEKLPDTAIATVKL